MTLFDYGGLILESDLPLPDLPPVENRPDRQRDCRFVLEPAAGRPGSPDRWEHDWVGPDGRVCLRWARREGRYWLGFPGAALFAVAGDGREIRCRAEPGTPDVTLRHLLLDQVLPRALALRDRWVLHAGAVLTPSGICGFLGESGAGKSTLCAALAARGHRLLGDEGLALRKTGTGVHGRSTYAGLRLWRDSLERFFGGDPGCPPVAHHTDKRRADVGPREPQGTVGWHPVARLYLLDAADRVPVGIRALSFRERFEALLRHSFQIDLAGRARARQVLEQAGELATALPLRRLAYPRAFRLLPAVCEAILADSSA